MGIYTRSGDHGQTSLTDGSRVSKSSARIDAIGAIDEAASTIGFARAAIADGPLDDILRFLQQRLMNCSSNLATPADRHTAETPGVTADDIAFVESAIDRLVELAGGVRGFVLPAGGETSSRIHLARTSVRNAERRCDWLAASYTVDGSVMAFLNRASDALFACALYAASLDDVEGEPWDAAANAPKLP